MSNITDIVVSPISAEPIVVAVEGGVPGPRGKSAYQSWLDAGNTGSEADFVAATSAVTARAPMPNAPATGQSTPPTIGSKIARFIAPEDYKLDSESDYTAAFNRAFAASPQIILTPGIVYNVGEITPPNGASITGLVGNKPNTEPRLADAKIKLVGIPGAANVLNLANSGIAISDVVVDGLDRTMDCVRLGGGGNNLLRVTATRGYVGFGKRTGFAFSTYLTDCNAIRNRVGLKNVRDSIIAGVGSYSFNAEWGVVFEAGSDTNEFEGRVSWNGDGGRGQYVGTVWTINPSDPAMYPEGGGVLVDGSSDHLFHLKLLDANWGVGFKSVGGTSLNVDGTVRRNGWKDGGVAGEDSHLYLANTFNSRFDFVAKKMAADNDQATHAETPKYLATIDQTGTGNKDVRITCAGWTEGWTVKPINWLNGNPSNRVAFEGVAAPKFPQTTGSLASGATGQMEIRVPRLWQGLERRTFLLSIEARDSASGATAHSATFVVHLRSDNAGAHNIAISAPIGEVGTAGYISFVDGASVELSLGDNSGAANPVSTIGMSVVDASAIATLRAKINAAAAHQVWMTIQPQG